jgi:hypothetical protein
MNVKHINYDKGFEEQHEPVLANVIKKVWTFKAQLTLCRFKRTILSSMRPNGMEK